MEKIQLRHPAGKKAIRMDSDKYEALRNVMLNHLKKNHESTHTEMLHAITENFKKNKIKFEGSIEWYMEWVKLDLEARNEIKRSEDTSPIKFGMA